MTTAAAVQVDGLTYGYRGGRPVVDGLGLTIPAGGLTALTGPSGTGKSTLLYLLAGMLTPWSGQVVFQGAALDQGSDPYRSRRRAKNFGFVFQDFALDPRRSVLDAVLEPCLYAGVSRRKSRPRARELLTQLGVEIAPSMRPGEISGGQAQRVAVCRALLLRPRVIFADEPTGNLDNASAHVVLDALSQAANDGCAVIIATHDDRVVARCETRVVLA